MCLWRVIRNPKNDGLLCCSFVPLCIVAYDLVHRCCDQQTTVSSLAIQSASTAVQNTLQVTAGAALTTYAGNVIYGALTTPVVAGTKLLALSSAGTPLLTVTTTGTTATNGLTVTSGGVSVAGASTFTGPVGVTSTISATSFQVCNLCCEYRAFGELCVCRKACQSCHPCGLVLLGTPPCGPQAASAAVTSSAATQLDLAATSSSYTGSVIHATTLSTSAHDLLLLKTATTNAFQVRAAQAGATEGV